MTGQPKPQCPKCGAHGEWILCKQCADFLVKDLAELPELYEELQVTISRQGRISPGGKSSVKLLPYEDSDRERSMRRLSNEVKNELTTRVRDLDIGEDDHPADTIGSLCAWLIARIERIRGHEDAVDMCTATEHLKSGILGMIDRPKDLMFCGKCDVCAGDLCADPEATEGLCRKCKLAGITTAFDPQRKRVQILARLEHYWGTVSDCARILPNYGIEVSEQVIRDWARKPDKHGVVKLLAKGFDATDRPLYRLGDVMDLAKQRAEWKATRKRTA